MAAGDLELAVIVLAAGEGTRMKSAQPKVLHGLAGRPMLAYPLEVARTVSADPPVVVVGVGAEEVQERFAGLARFVVQEPRRGTGDAVLQAQPLLKEFRGPILIMYGDTPLLRADTIARMLQRYQETQADLVLLSARLPLPGRVVRDSSGAVERIIEVTDASEAELAIEEGNTGVYLVDSELLWKTLPQLDDRNEQGELYVTDVVGHAVRDGRRVEGLLLDEAEEALGVNTRAELATAAAALRRRKAEALMAEGVTLIDPSHTYIDMDVEIGRDSVIEPGCVLSGDTKLGERVHLKAHSVIESSRIDDDAAVGPMARLRPGTHVSRAAKIGNFVEIKNSEIGEGVKAAHLTYIGDAEVGAGALFGCGAVVVNYDGEAKHRTEVGENAFVGCNVNLIAPIRVEDDAFVAAGSTVTQNVPRGSLAVARVKQRIIEGWRKRQQKKKGRE